MKPIFVERLLQPRYALNFIKRKFWRLLAILKPFDNVAYHSRTGTYAHNQWLRVLIGTHGYRCEGGKLVYFEQY